MMKQLIFIFLLCFSIGKLFGQDPDEKKPSTLVFHSFYNDFTTAQQIRTSSLKNVLDNHLWSKLGQMQMGFGVNYMKGINKNLDFVSTLDGSSTDYLYKNATTNGKSAFLLDANAAVNLKLLSDRHKIVPYLSGGAGFSMYQSKSGFYLPVGAGLQFNLINEAFVFTNFQYRKGLTSFVNNHFQYSVGVGTSIGKKKQKIIKTVQAIPVAEPVQKEIEISPRDLIVSVLDEATGQPLPFVAVSLKGNDGKLIYGSTDDYGRVIFRGVNPGDYSVSGTLNQITSTTKEIKKEGFNIKESQINISLTHNDPRFTLAGTVINKTRQLPEGDAEVNVTNLTENTNTKIESKPVDGTFHTQLKNESDFSLVGKKANYISNIEKITTKGLNRSTTLYVKLELEIEEAGVGQSIKLKNIYFEVGKANLNTSVSSDLDKLIRFLKDNPDVNLEIQGHTDNKGKAEMNLRLSQSRANSVVEYLTKNGIQPGRLIAKGYGSSLPETENITPEGRSQNRRVVMKVVH